MYEPVFKMKEQLLQGYTRGSIQAKPTLSYRNSMVSKT
jgi:hypothetical protein